MLARTPRHQIDPRAGRTSAKDGYDADAWKAWEPSGQSGTMALIDALVAKLPPFPLSAPLPLIGTADQYASQPCSTPRARYMPRGVCHCGFLMGEHQKGGKS